MVRYFFKVSTERIKAAGVNRVIAVAAVDVPQLGSKYD
jgi:hypothetical protein